MKHLTLLATITATGMGLWFAIHSKAVPDAAVWGYIAGMNGILSLRIIGDEK